MPASSAHVDPSAQRQFAVDVARTLRAAGFEALFAGGCVRDQLLGKTPQDYDVATSAHPEQIRALFGRKRTLAIGASFGVIAVLGPKPAGQIDVATFRRDATYSDGRRPDSVEFSTAEQDAMRRDFTINGMFFDPLAECVIDYVGGQADLQAKLVRAIGDPHERFGEDKLRMLRAVRFAATYGFRLDPATRAAVRALAPEVAVVSAERIAGEMRRMLTHAARAEAIAHVWDAHLWPVVLPELAALEPTESPTWRATLATLQSLQDPAFPTALAALLHKLPGDGSERAAAVRAVGQRWKLATAETELATWLLAHDQAAAEAAQRPWPEVQRILIQPGVGELLKLIHAELLTAGAATTGLDFCRAKLALPAEELNPPPLITGVDLKLAGLKPGPAFKQLLDGLRDAQLRGEIATPQEALALAAKLIAAPGS